MKGIGALIVTHDSEAEIGPCLDAVLGRAERVAFWYGGSLLRYSFKHYRLRGQVGVSAAVAIRCVVGMLYGTLKGWKRGPLKVYGRVIWFACLRLVSGRIGEAGSSPVLARQ